ncbi:hypothetical protein [Arcanobacterium sp. S3PF19]|nr:hypothetical protein [Arcanobacterium sp. S3PF19]
MKTEKDRETFRRPRGQKAVAFVLIVALAGSAVVSAVALALN